MNSLLSSMQFYEARATGLPHGNSSILAHSVGQPASLLIPMIFEKTRVNRLAAPESLVDAVPELDSRFAQLPAEIDFFALEQHREVDEPDIQILHQAAELVNLLDGLFKSGRGLFAAFFLFHDLSPIHPHTAQDRQPRGEGLRFLFSLGIAGF